MRFLIVAAAVFACAAAAPSGALLASPYSGLIATPWASPVAVASPLAVARTVALPAAVPTIPPGDIQGAAQEANAAAVDAVQSVHDQASELQGRAINAAEDNAWQSVSAVQTAQAQVDGAAASIAPNVAKSLVGPVAPVATYAAAPALLAPGINTLGYARSIVTPGIPTLGYARSIAAPGIIAGSGIVAGSQSISTQSLSQTHPSLLVSAPVSYAAHGW